MKTINSTDKAAIERVAKNVNKYLTTYNNNLKMIEKLTQENENLDKIINGHEGGIIAMTGYRSDRFLTKVISKIDKYNKDGKQLTKTEYVPTKYLVHNEEGKWLILDDSDFITEESANESCSDGITTDAYVESDLEVLSTVED